MKELRMCLLVVMGLWFYSCSLPAQENDLTVNLEVGEFNTIEISNNFVATLEKSETFSVQIKIPSAVKDELETHISGKKIAVGFSCSFIENRKRNKLMRHCKPVIRITAPSFENLELNGAVNLDLVGDFEMNDVFIKIGGASNIYGDYLKAKNLKLYACGASDVRMKLFAENLKVKASGSSDVYLKPMSDKAGTSLILDISGASDVIADELPYESVVADLSGASDGKVYPLKKLRVDASGASDLIYIKSSTLRDKDLDSSGGSSIRSR